MADQYKVVYYISIGAIFNDLERPMNPMTLSDCYNLFLFLSVQ